MELVGDWSLGNFARAYMILLAWSVFELVQHTAIGNMEIFELKESMVKERSLYRERWLT